MQIPLPLLAVMGALAVAGCGQTHGERALSGAGLGAAGGAAVGAVTGGSLLTGAVVGGLGGAAMGALTSPSDVNLGRPAWRR